MQEQHFFNLKSNIAMEHDVASNSFRTQILVSYILLMHIYEKRIV